MIKEDLLWKTVRGMRPAFRWDEDNEVPIRMDYVTEHYDALHSEEWMYQAVSKIIKFFIKVIQVMPVISLLTSKQTKNPNNPST